MKQNKEFIKGKQNKKHLDLKSQKFSKKLNISSFIYNQLNDLQSKNQQIANLQIDKDDLSKNDHKSQSTESQNEQQNIEITNQQNTRLQSLDSIKKQSLFNTPPKQLKQKQFFSPDKYFKSQLYEMIPERDELDQFEQLFLNCITCECCNGYVDECNGETCKILGQCYCFSQIETEKKHIDIQDNDSDIIAEFMKQIEQEQSNWEEIDQLN